MTKNKLSKLKGITIKLIGIIILAKIISSSNIKEVFAVFEQVDKSKLLPLYLIVIPINFIASLRVYFFLIDLKFKKKYFDVLKLYFAGLLLGMITPGRVGEMYVVVRLIKYGCSKLKSLLVVIIPRIIDLTLLSIGGLYAFRMFFGNSSNDNKLVYIFLVGFIIFIFILITFMFFLKKPFWRFVNLIITKVFKENIDLDDVDASHGYITNISIVKLVLLTASLWLLYFFQVYLAGNLLGIHLSFFTYVLILSLSSIAAAMPITFLGVGTRELAMVACFGVYGIDKEPVLALALIIYSLLILHALIASVFWMFEHK